MKTFLIVFAATSAFAADIDVAAAKKAEQRECTACHSMRLTHSQRLSPTAWGKELDKMAGWGAQIKDRQLLLELEHRIQRLRTGPARPALKQRQVREIGLTPYNCGWKP